MKRNDGHIGVALVGCGTVGGAVGQLLTRETDTPSRANPPVQLRHIVDVDFAHAKSLGLDEKLFREDLEQALDDEQVQIVVELIGGTTVAKDVITRAIQAGKHVVTANKALLAEAGVELHALARRQGVCLAYEASCGGGVPIVRALCDGLIANRIDAIYGIVNGTCNYILTSMTQSNVSYADALAQAQADGLAEADPTLDVSGEDSAHKLAILASLAFAKQVNLQEIYVEGIDKLQLCDIDYGRELGYVIRLLAIGQQVSDGLLLRVRPAFIAKDHPLAWVSGPFNAISVYGHATGHTIYYGRGAGARPTASAVLADVVSIAIGTAQRRFSQLNIWPDQSPPARQLPIEAVRSRYYIRVSCVDRPGVLARIAEVLGENDISILSVLQREPRGGQDPAQSVPVVIITHTASEGSVRKAIERIDRLDVIKDKTVCIAVVDEYPERFS